MSITRHRRFKHVLSGVALSTLMAGFVALSAAPANAADGPVLLEALNLDNTTHIVNIWEGGNPETGSGEYRKIALDNPGYSKDDGPLITNKRTGGANQRWHFTRQKDRTYKIENMDSHKCVTAVSHWVYQTKCEKGPRQSWTIKQLAASPSYRFNFYQIVNVGTGKALSRYTTGNPPKPPKVYGSTAAQNIPNGNDENQMWRLDN